MKIIVILTRDRTPIHTVIRSVDETSDAQQMITLNLSTLIAEIIDDVLADLDHKNHQ